VAVPGKVKDNDPMSFGEIGNLRAPVAGVTTPAVDKHQRRFSGAMDLVRNRGDVLRQGDPGPFRSCLGKGKKQEEQAADQGQDKPVDVPKLPVQSFPHLDRKFPHLVWFADESPGP
jgi:hypothetical protein